ASGGRGVASSNLVTPTNQKILVATATGICFFTGPAENLFSRRTGEKQRLERVKRTTEFLI
ncbi:MAG: hypothetical protein QM301_04120, partial [Bacteroidota bacterium]|nr:hypothetical protein [Bacteroidota bacterium]